MRPKKLRYLVLSIKSVKVDVAKMGIWDAKQ